MNNDIARLVCQKCGISNQNMVELKCGMLVVGFLCSQCNLIFEQLPKTYQLKRRLESNLIKLFREFVSE